MRVRLSVVTGIIAGALLGACASESGPTGPQVRIATAPLDGTSSAPFAAIDSVDYGLTVYNGDPEFDASGVAQGSADVVWTKGSVTSTDYGNGPGGAISYVGPCDASVTGNNFVALVLNKVFAGSPAVQLSDQFTIPSPLYPDFQNPCPSTAPCVLDFACQENADVAVEFNLTIMRRAQQGFFDIAVNFEDVFCSAKFDSCYEGATTHLFFSPIAGLNIYLYLNSKGSTVTATFDEGQWLIRYVTSSAVIGVVAGVASTPPTAFELDINGVPETFTPLYGPGPGTPIKLLFGANGREHTAVAAMACTVGADTDTADLTTELLLLAPTVVCDEGVTFTLDLDGLDGGNHTQAADGEDPEAPAHTLAFGLYFGAEDLDCGRGPGSCNKVYYNIAFNIEDLAGQGLTNCNLFYGATATESVTAPGGGGTATFENGQLVDPSAVYGGVSFGYATGGVPLTIGSDPSCVNQPLDGLQSQVESTYVKGAAFGDTSLPGFAFYTTGGPAAAFGSDQGGDPIGGDPVPQ